MVLSSRSKLEGTVEVNEVFVGGKTPGKRGRGAEGKSLIAIGIEVKGRKTGRVKMEKIPDASANSLKNFIEKNIESSSTIITDGWLGYAELKELGYKHKIQKSTVKDEDEEVLPNVHRVASLLKMAPWYASKLFE
jgi:transposase-like protein